MNFKIYVVILFTVFIHATISGQPDTYFLSTKVVGQFETYSVIKASFSTDKYDEFSPVCYQNSIVFCSNRPITKIMNLSTEQNKGMIKINAFDSVAQGYPPTVRLFSKNINTKLNDGPVTFNSKGDTIYFSKNLKSDGKLSELSSVRNKLGVFYAVFDGQDWTKVRELRFNSEWYNITTPWISPDGKRLYFASDKPGGYGGSDLYYCPWKVDYWDEPVNLGPVINTKGNESYPFVNGAGEFFFSSDGHPGFGGKDIFFSRLLSDSSWIEPICLDAPLNSQYDDFGIYTDTLMSKGYFSSNRDNSLDIFQFETRFPQVFYQTQQKENNYCFIFNDSGSIVLDTINLQYRWSFGDGKSTTGTGVSHCFPGPGNYNVRLDIIERNTGRQFFTKLIYNFEIRDFEQPFINAPDYAVKGDKVSFDGLESYLPGFRILHCFWNFGDNTRAEGEKVAHSYEKSGEYIVNLELTLKCDSNCLIKKTGVSKKIMILNDQQEAKSYKDKGEILRGAFPDYRKSTNSGIKLQYSSESELAKDAVFCIELLHSVSKVDVNGGLFRNVPGVYKIRERFNQSDSTYSYTVDQHMNLMSTFPAYLKMAALGFKDVKVKLFALSDQSEKDLYNLLRINGTFADFYFDYSDKLTSNAFIMLDQIVKLMNKYPLMKLEIAVHTDNNGTPESVQALSQKRAQLLTDYLINRGINARRLVAAGYGGSKPIASNLLEKGRRLNRRIDFSIIGK
jgi:outer membrane protein OmpA-like peptidoglycan-associated protein